MKTTDAERASALIGAAAEIAPLAREAAAETEALGSLPQALLAALHDRRLFRLWIPHALGGEELDLPPALEIYELLANADGSVGWNVMIGAGAGLFGGFLERDTAQEIFGPRDAVVAGSGAPNGNAREVSGGYRVRGRWSFASGAPHATWFTANCTVADSNAIRAVAVPAAEVEVFDTWSVHGLRGTGSHDFAIQDRLVPRARTFSVLTDSPHEAGPLYRFPFFSTAELSFAAVALGIARRALDEFRLLANEKRPAGTQALLRDDADVQSRYARAEAAVRSSRTWLYDVANRAWETVTRGETPTELERAGIRLAAIETVERCARAVDSVYDRAGMTPVFMSSALGRAWRDIHALTQNAVVSAGPYADVGLRLLTTSPRVERSAE